MLGPPARDGWLRRLETDVAPPTEPGMVNGVSALAITVVVGQMGGHVVYIPYAGPDSLSVGDYVWVRRVPRAALYAYEYVGRRTSIGPLGATTHTTNDPTTGDAIPPTVATPLGEGAIPSSILSRIVALEAQLNGHQIIGPDGTVYPQRGKLKFVGDFVVTDDAVNDQTIVSVSITSAGLSYNASEIGYNDDVGYND